MSKEIETSFENFYDKFDQTEFQEPWVGAVKSRKKSLKISLIICAILDAIILIYFIRNYFYTVDPEIISFVFFVVFVLIITDFFVIIFAFLFRSHKNDVKYAELYKSHLIGGMLNNFFSDVNYNPYNGISRSIYDSGLYKEYYNEYNSDDYVEAVFKEKNPVRIAEVHTVDVETHTDSDGHTHTTRTTRFHGLFAQVSLQKNIGCNLRIRKNKLFKQPNEIEMDHAEFEKMFDVDSDDRIKAMQFLTHDVMEELINFYKNTNCQYDVFIKENIIYIRLHTGAVFESVIDKKEVINKNTAHRYFNILKFLYNLSDKISSIAEDDKF